MFDPKATRVLILAAMVLLIGCSPTPTPTLFPSPIPTLKPTSIPTIITTLPTPTPISLKITAPANNAQIAYRPFIEGTISNADATVWVILHPMAISVYYVQPPVTGRGDGTWKVQIYAGDQNAGIGDRFEIMAVVNPQQSLKEGQQLSAWPIASSKSNVIEVIRVAESVSSLATPTLVGTPSLSALPASTPRSDARVIFGGGKLSDGYDMGIDTSGKRRDWMTQQGDAMCMAYPSGQDWGAVFITVGKAVDVNRPGQDFSKYSKLAIELRGDAASQSVLVGLKDSTNPDNGLETKIPASLTPDWKTVEFPLTRFNTADLRRLYVVTEFVFDRTPANVCFRNIQFMP